MDETPPKNNKTNKTKQTKNPNKTKQNKNILYENVLGKKNIGWIKIKNQ